MQHTDPTASQAHYLDDSGNPAGGYSMGRGYGIKWQQGPLKDPATGAQLEPNGAFVETILQATLGRMEHYQTTKFACDANERIIQHIQAAIDACHARTQDRVERGVEGTHQE